MERESRAIIIVSFLLVIITTYLSEIIFQELKLAIIAGLLVGIFAHQYGFHHLATTWRTELKSEAGAYNEKLLDIMWVNNEYYADTWLKNTLEKITALRESSKINRHEKKKIEDEFGSVLARMTFNVGLPNTQPFGEDIEYERMTQLIHAVTYADRYVYAITFDSRNYFESFWDIAFGRPYIEANIKAAQRGVHVERVFVIDRYVAEGTDKDKRRRLNEVIRRLASAGPQMKLYVTTKEKLKQHLPGTDVSSLVCDDSIASESTGLSDGKHIQGYVARNTIETIDRLKARFEKIKNLADELKGKL